MSIEFVQQVIEKLFKTKKINMKFCVTICILSVVCNMKKCAFINIHLSTFCLLFLHCTGGSGYSGADVMSQESDDHHSAIASSVVSSRGSFSGSHDNISSSREYMPLESSSPKPGTATAASEGWITFGDARAIASSTPSKPSLEKGITQNGTPERGHMSSPIPPNWVQFDDRKNEVNSSITSSRASSRPSPVSSPSNNSPPKEPSPSDYTKLNGRDSVERTEQQPQGVSHDHSQVDRRNIEESLQSEISQSRVTPLHMTDHANDMEVSILSANADVADTKYEAASPGNPFKEDVLNLKQREKQKIMDEQVQRTVSPYNPFLNTGKLTTDGTSEKVEKNIKWTTFDERAEVPNKQISSPSPGNPFANMATTANVHNRPNLNQPYDPYQQANVNPSLAVQQNILSSQPTRQVVAVQPLPQSTSTGPVNEQRTAALLSPNMYGSQPASPFSTKPNQWQPQQQFFPTSQQRSYAQATPTAAAKQPIAAIVSPTTSAASTDMPDSGKPELKTMASVKSNISSPGVDKTVDFQDSYPQEQVDLSEGWSLKLRRPDKKKLAGSRYWEPVHVRLSEGNILQLFNDRTSHEPFRELPLQCNYELGVSNLQQFDVRGKIHTIKLFYVSYKERRTVSAKSFYEKAPYQEELIKLGSLDFKVYKSFAYTVNDALMRLTLFQDRGAHYRQDLISVTIKDDFRCLVDPSGEVARQSTTVDVTVLSFLSGSPDCAIGLNDMQVKGLDIVDRQHIIPNKTSDWIQLHNVDLHKCANKNVFVDSRMIEFQPLNACRFRLMQFQVKPSKEDLPLQVRAVLSGEGTHVEMRVDLLVPGEKSLH